MVLDRTDLWLPFLRRLTDTFPRWAVWKNVESALAGTGDVDSFAPPGDWTAIQQVFLEWAGEQGMGPAVICRHIPQGPHFVTFQPGAEHIVQLDVKERGTFRGSTLIDAETLLPLTEIDDRGFRRVRPGVEGVIKLCMNGVLRGGRANWDGLESKRVAQLLQSDPEGVVAAASLLGPAEEALLRGARAVEQGSWDRRAMATVEAWSLLRSAGEPQVPLSRVWFYKVSGKRCSLVQLIRQHDRRVPEDLDGWLALLARNHEIHPVTA